MFSAGFQKTAAGPVQAVQATRGYVQKGFRAATKGVKEFASSQKAKGIASYRQAIQPTAVGGAPRKAPGEALAALRAKKSPDVVDAQSVLKGAKADVGARSQKMKDSKVKSKPSFARKHPLLTAGALYLGTKAALGGGDDNKQSQQPQYVGPQY